MEDPHYTSKGKRQYQVHFLVLTIYEKYGNALTAMSISHAKKPTKKKASNNSMMISLLGYNHKDDTLI